MGKVAPHHAAHGGGGGGAGGGVGRGEEVSSRICVALVMVEQKEMRGEGEEASEREKER
jgi:hypothetical protein